MKRQFNHKEYYSSLLINVREDDAKEYDLFGIAPEGDDYHPLSDKADDFFIEEQSWQTYHVR